MNHAKVMSDPVRSQIAFQLESIIILKFLKDSLETRHEMGGHARGYLDFLKRFIGTGDAR